MLISSINKTFSQYLSRFKLFKPISISLLLQAIITPTAQIIMSKKFDALGLVYGYISGFVVVVLFLLLTLMYNKKFIFSDIRKKRIKANAKVYNKFPKFQSLAALINSSSQNLPIILLSYFFNSTTAGFYNLTFRTLSRPVSIISNSTRQVYYQKASELVASNKSIKKLFNTTTISLLRIIVIPIVVFSIFSPSIFSFIFGNEWLISGEFARYVVFISLFAMINPPATATVQILLLQKLNLAYEVLLLIFRVLAIYLGYILFNNPKMSIIFFTVVSIIFNLFIILYIKNLLDEKQKSKNSDS
jgi:O-antigen/teichoic acid export membrane protein